MPGITLTGESLQLIGLFDGITKAHAIDVLETEDAMGGRRLIFIVEEGQLGLAVGREAVNIKRLKEALKKDIQVIGYSEKTEKFVKNIFHRVTITKVEFRSGPKVDENGEPEGFPAGMREEEDAPADAPPPATPAATPPPAGTGGLTVIITVSQDDKGKAIGKGGRNLKLAREILQRHKPEIVRVEVAQ